MRLKFGVLVLCLLLDPAARAKKQVLPDACGDEKVEFAIKTQKDAPPPAAPAPDKAEIVFVEISNKPFSCHMAWGTCGSGLTRYGVDGSWVGATKGNTYFTLIVDPGVHHLCAVLGKSASADALTAEAGKTYYYSAEFDVDVTDYGDAGHPNTSIKKNAKFSMLSEDQGKYRVKASELSIATPKQ
jgi:hypothetical protein